MQWTPEARGGKYSNACQGSRLYGGNGSHHLHCSTKSGNTTSLSALEMFTKTTQRNVFFPVQIHIPGPLPTKQQVPENFRTHQACKSQDSVGCCSLSGSLQSPLAPRKAHEAYEKSLFLTPRRRHSPGFQPAPHHKEMQSQQLWVSMTGTPKDI